MSLYSQDELSKSKGCFCPQKGSSTEILESRQEGQCTLAGTMGTDTCRRQRSQFWEETRASLGVFSNLLGLEAEFWKAKAGCCIHFYLSKFHLAGVCD